MSALLEVDGLNLRFRRFEGVAHVLRDVALTLSRGERVALVGESGCGKSVFLRAVLGLLEGRTVDLDGTIRFDGEEVGGQPPAAWRRLRGRRIGMIFQDPVTALNPVFTVGDQLATVIRRGEPRATRRRTKEVAREALRRVHIDDPDRVLASYPFQLSGGMSQRVLITMALVNRPALVLADEPGTSLDVTVQEQTLRLMRELTVDSGSAVLLVAHNLGVVREFAERVYVMYGGTIVEEGPVAALFDEPRHPYTQALMRAVPRLTGGELPEPIEGSVPDYIDPPSGCRFRPRCPHAASVCARVPARVEVAPGHAVLCTLYEPGARDA